MKISQTVLNLICEFEGYHRRLPNGDCTTYYCPAGVLTIGFGCTEGIKEGDVWTQQQAQDKFRAELVKHEAAVARMATVDLNQNQFDALVSFSYNCGTGALQKSTLLKKVNAGDWQGAGKAFALFNRGGGKVLPGLVRRRAAEAALFLKPAETAAEPDMPQAVDAPTAKPQGSRTITTANVGQAVTFTGLVTLLMAKLGEMLGYATQILPLVTSYGVEALIVLLMILSSAFALINYFRTEDHVEGKNPT